jgi:hypothetical protein
MRARLSLGYVVGVLTVVVVCFASTALELRYSDHHGWPHALRAATGFSVTIAVLLLAIVAVQHRRAGSRG